MKVEFIYSNGVSQIKEVISHDIFLNIIKPSKERIHILSSLKKLTIEETAELKELKNKLRSFDGEWCTDQSPLGKAIQTGMLELPENQGGNHIVQITLL